MSAEEEIMIGCEALMRRAAAFPNEPFMLKGSFITRQFFKNPEDRKPADLDWVYMKPLNVMEYAQKGLNAWAIAVTERDESHEDGVVFRSFTKNAFWRRIDYFMKEDFPTVNTDLEFKIDDSDDCDISMDVSFNLPIRFKPEPLLYQPLRGKAFIIPFTVPLSVQVSWKLHQTLVRPRFKDLFDLTHMLAHSDYTRETREETIRVLMEECEAGKVDKKRIWALFTGDLYKLFKNSSYYKNLWHYWRYDMTIAEAQKRNFQLEYADMAWAHHITEPEKLPADLEPFEQQFVTALHNAGLTIDFVNTHPYMNK